MPVKETLKTIWQLLGNEMKAAVGYQQSFEELLESNDVSRAISMLENRGRAAMLNLSNYHTDTHVIKQRPGRNIYNKKGEFLYTKELNTIAIPYQKFINEVALVFLYGRPVLWKNATKNPYQEERERLAKLRDTIGNYDDPAASEEQRAEAMQAMQETKMNLEQLEKRIDEIDAETAKSDAAYGKLIEELHQARFDAHLREAKRYAGAEGCSALLFHTYQQDGEAKMLIRTLAKSKNDDIYTLFDQYDRLVAFAWGYNTRDINGKSVRHYDIYTANTIYNCEQNKFGKWESNPRPNPIGKIPVIVFIQEVEWEGAETMINRVEKAFSINADNIDDFGSPAIVATGAITNSDDMAAQEEESKVFELRDGGDLKYLELDNIGAARKEEIAMLESQIMEKTFTPTITLEALRGLSNASGATLRTVMMLANIKADRRKDSHDGLLSRTSSLMKSIMGNVLDKQNKTSYDGLVIEHEFQEPFGADVAQTFNDLIRQYGAGAISIRTVLEQSYLVPNAEKELERMKQEQEEADERKREQMVQDAFAMAE